MLVFHIVSIGALLCYTLSAIVYLIYLGRYSVNRYTVGVEHPLEKIALYLLRFGFFLQCLSLVNLFISSHNGPLNDSADYFFWIAWCLALSSISFKLLNSSIIGVLVASLASLFLASSSWLLHTTSYRMHESNIYLLVLHAFPLLLAQVYLALAFITSFVFLLKERSLKLDPARALRLKGPSLEVLERLNLRFVRGGFIAISIGVLSGIAWAATESRHLFSGGFWEWLALTVWLLLGGLLHLQSLKQWSGKKVSFVTLCIVAIMFVSLLLGSFIIGRDSHGKKFGRSAVSKAVLSIWS